MDSETSIGSLLVHGMTAIGWLAMGWSRDFILNFRRSQQRGFAPNQIHRFQLAT